MCGIVYPEENLYNAIMSEITHDLIIIGAGAAGLTAAQYGARSNLNTLVLDAAGNGGQMLNIMHLENYPGVFPAVNGYDFSEIMAKQAAAFGAQIIQTSVQSLLKEGNVFTVTTAAGVYAAPAVILATGAEHRKLGVPGESELSGRGVSYCATCDGPFFRKKRIIVVGGGDAACDEAVYLATLSDTVTVVHRRGQFRAQKAVGERVLNNKNITVRFFSIIKEIRGTDRVESVLLENTETGAQELIEADAVFIYAGMNPRTELFPDVRRDAAGYIAAGEDCATSVPGLFCAGDVRSKPFRQVVTAAADGASAAHSAEQYIRVLRNEVYA